MGSINQLYPLLIAPVFASGSVADGLHRAHVLNAFAITSAAVPAYLLALRVTRDVGASALAAALTVIVPWIVLSSFLLTEVAAYPAFVWALLAVHVALKVRKLPLAPVGGPPPGRRRLNGQKRGD